MLRFLGVVTGEQLRAGRALARIDQAELARLSGLSVETVKRLERIRGPVDAKMRTVNAIVAGFEGLGVLFDRFGEGGVGIRRASFAAQERPEAPVDAPAKLAYQLIYHSKARPALLADLKAGLAQIEESGTRRNPELNVTGVLFACNGRFLQVLEGDKAPVLQVYGAISLDSRHTDLQVLEGRPIPSPHFPDWTLCCGMFPSDRPLFEQEPAMADVFAPERLSPAAALGILTTMRDLQRMPPRRTRGNPATCALADECLDLVCSSGVRLSRPHGLSAAGGYS
jgi:transcriptional regulator with XRE-family HTH domain